MAERVAVIGAVAGMLCARTPGHPLRVAVDGITSAGKTTFADEARELFRPLGPSGGPGATGTWRYRDRIIDLPTDQPVESWADAAPDAVLVVDGSFLQRDELRELWDEVIYLDVAFDVALARGAARDAAAFGGRDAAVEAFRLRYHAAGHRYLDEIDPRRRATIVIDHNDLAYPRLMRPPAP